jgi:hypothetical protein
LTAKDAKFAKKKRSVLTLGVLGEPSGEKRFPLRWNKLAVWPNRIN